MQPVRTDLEFSPGSIIAIETGRVGKTPSVGLTVKHAGRSVAVHLAPYEARAQAKALVQAADEIDPGGFVPVADQVPARDRMIKK